MIEVLLETGRSSKERTCTSSPAGNGQGGMSKVKLDETIHSAPLSSEEGLTARMGIVPRCPGIILSMSARGHRASCHVAA